MIWSPHANPGLVLFGAAPRFQPALASPVALDLSPQMEGPEGRYGVFGAGGQIPFLNVAAIGTIEPAAVLLPLDEDLPGRIEAIRRFWQMLMARPVPRDGRMTPYQRQRIRLMMQAADGRAQGAHYRDIGVAIYGEARVANEPWKTSALRAVVIALVRNAGALIAGGYLGLLRHRRKP